MLFFFTDQEILEKIKDTSKLTEKMKVLDAGCGPGIVTEALAARAIEEEFWEKESQFSEWIAITNSPERDEPLKIVMNTLAQVGIDAGINLRSDDHKVYFDHRWVLITASK